MIDAGSKGTRLSIYKEKDFELEFISYIKIKIPLSEYINNNSILIIIFNKFQEQIKKDIDKKDFSKINLYCYGTGGMRNLPIITQNNIYDSFFNLFKINTNYNINKNNFKTISGQDEANFGWLSINYLFENLQKDKETLGILDLGGASLQLANEVPNNIYNENISIINLGKKNYHLYSISLQNYGSVSSWEQMLTWNYDNFKEYKLNPCLSLGVIENNHYGIGNFNQCYDLINNNIIENNNIFKNIPNFNNDFIAFSDFGKINDELKLKKDSSLKDLLKIGEKICSSTLSEKIENDIKNYKELCFKIVYQYTILSKGFKMNQKIEKIEKKKGIDISWSLGAIFYNLFQF